MQKHQCIKSVQMSDGENTKQQQGEPYTKEEYEKARSKIDEIVQEYSQLIDKYEEKRKSGKYNDETQKIRENFSDKGEMIEEKFQVKHNKHIENEFESKKLNNDKELEDKLDEEELIEACEDEHGIGRELLSKIKNLYMDRGEK